MKGVSHHKSERRKIVYSLTSTVLCLLCVSIMNNMVTVAFYSPASTWHRAGQAFKHPPHIHTPSKHDSLTRAAASSIPISFENSSSNRRGRNSTSTSGTVGIKGEKWPLTVYDGEAVERHYAARPWEVTDRLASLGPPLVAWYVQTQIDNRTRQFIPEDVANSFNQQRASELRHLLANSGSVTFIKSGQALSLRQDLVKNAEFVKELAKLQDEVGTFPNDVAFDIIKSELGRPANAVYQFLQRDPIASASIGQVYKARVRATGELVALKVQRPDAFSSAAIDMFILRRFAAWFRQWKKLRTDLVAVADEFGAQLFNELDYVQEGRNCEKFRQLYGGIPGIYVPTIVSELTTRRVLTMEWVEGEKGPWFEDGKRLLTVGLQCSVLQILDSGFFHADPHRGNLLRMADGRLAYLDFGMMCSVPAETRYALVGATLGLQNKDVDLVAENLIRLGFLPDSSKVDVVVPALERAIFDASSGMGASRLNFTRLGTAVSDLSERLQFRVPPFYSLVVRTLSILEGLALSVDPDFRLIMGAYPYIAKQVLNSNSPEMRALMKATLLTPEGDIRWKRLEELVSIAGAANVAETDEQFMDLKKAQGRSDLRVKSGLAVGTQPETTAVTLELTLAILDFIMSDGGRFLREPLIREMLETIDSVGVLAQSRISQSSRGLIGKPNTEPDNERLSAVWGLVMQVIINQRGGENSTKRLTENGRSTAISISTINNVDGSEDLPMLRSLAYKVRDILRDPEQTALFLPIALRLAGLARELGAQLIERQAVRAVKGAISLVGNPTVFPVLVGFLDAVVRLSGIGSQVENSQNSLPPSSTTSTRTSLGQSGPIEQKGRRRRDNR